MSDSRGQASDGMGGMRASNENSAWPLVGLETLRAELEKMQRSGRRHHALLLTGPRGVGKRTLALRLARAALCSEQQVHPFGCGSCPPCHRVDTMQHPDLHVIRRVAGKTGISAEQVRGLSEQFARAALEGRGRVALILDAEDLGREGQNSLLKTLEEPAPKRLLVLTTQKPELLLDTVRSRLRRIAVPPLSTEELAGLLSSEAEEPAEAVALAELAEGSVGEARRIAAEGLGDWRELLAPLTDARSVSAVQFASAILEGAEKGEEGLRQGKRLRAERALFLALRFARREARAGDREVEARLSAILSASARLRLGISAELVLQGLSRDCRRLTRSGGSGF